MKNQKSNSQHHHQAFQSIHYDNHVIANSISQETVETLEYLGLEKKTVTGGDFRVKMKHLWSKKSSTLQEANVLFDKCSFYLNLDKNFVGYIEEEVIIFDEQISYLPIDRAAWDSMLPQLNPSPCPEGIYKACDIHLTIHKTNPLVEKKLLEAGFYYLELDKSDLGKVRIYTMQAQDHKVGRKILEGLKKVLKQGGGVEGFLKFEATKNLHNHGFSLPPLILD